jgi:hypothetical protein
MMENIALARSENNAKLQRFPRQQNYSASRCFIPTDWTGPGARLRSCHFV